VPPQVHIEKINTTETHLHKKENFEKDLHNRPKTQNSKQKGNVQNNHTKANHKHGKNLY